MKSHHSSILRLPLNSLKQKNKTATFTLRFEFYLLHGEVFARDKSKLHESRGWTPLLDFKTHVNLPQELRQLIEDKKIIVVTADEANLNLVTEKDRVLYAKLDNDTIEWIPHWGLLNKFIFKERILYADPNRYKFISASHSPDYKGRPDGKNQIQGCLYGISGIYAYDTQTGYIVYSDAWWRSKFSHMLFTPNGLRLKGMSVSASTLAVVTMDNTVYTRLVDIDTGDNVALNKEYSLEAMENNLHPEIQAPVDFSFFKPATSMSFPFIKDVFRKRNLPISIWHEHPTPSDFLVSGAVTILQNGPNIRDDFELRVWGYKSEKYGYISKPIIGSAETWKFKPQIKKFQPEIQETIEDVASSVTKHLSGRLSFWAHFEENSVVLTIEHFNPYKDYNLVQVTIGQQKFSLYLFLVSQLHLIHQTYATGTLMLSNELKNSTDKGAQQFVKDYFGHDDKQTFCLKRKDASWDLSADKFRVSHPTKPLKLRLKEQQEIANGYSL